jgi:hypothetical protein
MNKIAIRINHHKNKINANNAHKRKGILANSLVPEIPSRQAI